MWQTTVTARLSVVSRVVAVRPAAMVRSAPKYYTCQRGGEVGKGAEIPTAPTARKGHDRANPGLSSCCFRLRAVVGRADACDGHRPPGRTIWLSIVRAKPCCAT